MSNCTKDILIKSESLIKKYKETSKVSNCTKDIVIKSESLIKNYEETSNWEYFEEDIMDMLAMASVDNLNYERIKRIDLLAEALVRLNSSE